MYAGAEMYEHFQRSLWFGLAVVPMAFVALWWIGRRRRNGLHGRSEAVRQIATTLALALFLVGCSSGGINVESAAASALRERAQTERTTARFDPPVLAGQRVDFACSSTGGFYARDQQNIVLTISAHCPLGPALRDADGGLVGTVGPPAELRDCPAERFCSPSDFMALTLEPDRIPWGHLNMVDLGAGGYRTFAQGTAPLACADIHTGDRVEVDGREHYRSGTVIEIGPYHHATDTIFPCIAVTDIDVRSGDSGGAVLVNGMPAGITARDIGGRLAFTPLAEGLANLGLVLCATLNCDLTPEADTGA